MKETESKTQNPAGNIVKSNFISFAMVWLKQQKLSLPEHQKQMMEWLEKLWQEPNRKKALLMAFRNSGKSTVIGLYCAWLISLKAEIRILVLAADIALAKKMVRNVKRIIERHPMCQGLKPSKADQWGAEQFTVNREAELRDSTMLAKGLGANITGLRADVIICDDVEVPKTCDTEGKREGMRQKLEELDYILVPGGLQIYVGTPHSFYTIYQTEVEAGKAEIAPFLLNFESLKIPILKESGQSAWPERFSLEKIADIRARSGESKFLSQMMLEPQDYTESILDTSQLVSYQSEIELSSVDGQDILSINGRQMISASCWWDPSFAQAAGDNSVIACVFTDQKGKKYLHDIAYIKAKEDEQNVADNQCDRVIEFLIKNKQPVVFVETNGIGKFLPSILRQKLAEKKIRVSVREANSTEKKELRIIQAFEVLLASRNLYVNQKIWQTKFVEEMRTWRAEKGCKDDALDAVAGCINSGVNRLNNLTIGGVGQTWQSGSRQYNADVSFEI